MFMCLDHVEVATLYAYMTLYDWNARDVQNIISPWRYIYMTQHKMNDGSSAFLPPVSLLLLRKSKQYSVIVDAEVILRTQ